MGNLIFAGTPEFSKTILEALWNTQHTIQAVLTQPDKKSGRGQTLQASCVKQFSDEKGLLVLQPNNLKSNHSIELQLKELHPDLMIVVAYGLILPENILRIPRLGCVNVHASLLPFYRGAAPIQRAILNGEKKTGITLMKMDAGLDTGDILSKHSCEILPLETNASLQKKLATLGAKALTENLEPILEQKLTSEKQDDQKASYAHKITKQEAQINWQTEHAEYIDRKVRAFMPWPIAFTTLGTQIIRIHEATPIHHETTAKPGTILEANPKTGLFVATTSGILSLETLQLPGKKPVTIKDLLNAHQKLFVVGKLFDSIPLHKA